MVFIKRAPQILFNYCYYKENKPKECMLLMNCINKSLRNYNAMTG